MSAFAITAGLLAFWLLVVWRVRVERGRVGVTAALRIQLRLRGAAVHATDAMLDVTRAFAALAPAMAKAAEGVRQFVDVLRRAGLLEPCPYCGHPPLDHSYASAERCVVVHGSLPMVKR